MPPVVELDFDPSLLVLDAHLRNFAIGLGDFSEPLREAVNEVMRPSIDRNFEVGGRPRWQPMAEATRERRAKSGSGDQLLVETGDLRAAATSFSVWNFTQNEAFVGRGDFPEDRDVVAAAHTDGTSTMPSRPFMVIQPEDAERIERIFAEHVYSRALAMWFL